jgi:hypothetical protein
MMSVVRLRVIMLSDNTAEYCYAEYHYA